MSDQEDPVEMDVGPDEERHAKESVKEKAVTPEEGGDSDDERKHKKKKKKKDKEKDKDRKKSRKSEKEDGKKDDEEGGSDGSGDEKEGENGKESKDHRADDEDDDLLKEEREKRNLKERDRGRERDSRDRVRERSRSRGRDHRDRDRRRRSASRERRRRSLSRECRRRSASRDRGRRDRDRERYRRPRSRSRSRSRDRSRRRKSRSSSDSRSPSRSKKRSPEKPKAEAVPVAAPVAAPMLPQNPTGIPTLQEMLQTYPGIGIPEALLKIEEIKRARAANPMMPMLAPQGAAALGAAAPSLLPQVAAQLAAAQQMASAIPNAAATKSQRELYVGNLPSGIAGPQLAEFLGGALMQLKLTTQPGNPIINTWMSSDAHYAFCEFRSIEECNAAINLNGISVGPNQLRIGRPKNYQGPQTGGIGMGALGMGGGLGALGLGGATAGLGMAGLGAGMTGLSLGSLGGLPGAGVGVGSLNPTALGLPSAVAPAAMVPTTNFLMMTNLPQAVDDMSVRALLQPFGELKSFNLLKDSEGKSKGTAVFEYSERTQAEAALKLSGIDIGGQKLQVQEISAAAAQALLKPVASTAAAEEGASVVIRLGNMVDESILSDADEVNEIKEEVADECRKFGSVVSLEIPVPQAGGERGAGQGYIFVEFSDAGAASRARKALKGRSFDGKTVEAEYYSKDLYDKKVYDGQTMNSASADAPSAQVVPAAEGAAAAAPAPEPELD